MRKSVAFCQHINVKNLARTGVRESGRFGVDILSRISSDAGREPPKSMYDNNTSVDYIESRFPAIADDLRNEVIVGLLHPQLAVFSRLAQGAIDRGDADLWREVTDAFMALWCNGTPEVTNALNVSFLEHLQFIDDTKHHSWAYEAMPHPMRKAWDDMYEYNRQLHGG